jgi:uncharacterized membrane protein YbhN (UPF0104 family)
MSRRNLMRVAMVACVAVVLVMMARMWASNGDRVQFSDVRWPYAAAALALLLAFVLTNAIAWATLLSRLDLERAAFVPSVRLFLTTWPGRYMPASLAHHGGRIVAGPAIGLTRSAVAASLVYENVFAIATGGGIALCALVALHGSAFAAGWVVAAMLAAGACLVALHPATARATVRFAARRIKRLRPLEQHVLPGRDIVVIGVMYCLCALIVGAAYWCALQSLSVDAPWWLVVAAYNIGGIAGLLAVFVPSGLGVREGVAAAVLGATVSPGAALSAAILLRLLAVIADVAPVVVLVVAGLVTRLRTRPAASPSVSALAEAVERRRAA